MRSSIILGIAGLALLTMNDGMAATLIPIVPVPGSAFTEILGVNNNNIIVGDWYDSTGIEHGYFGTLAGDYSTFDYSGNTAKGTAPGAINDNNLMVGFGPTDGTGKYFRGPQFEYDGATGTMTTIKKGKKPIDGVLRGLNSAGEFAGERWVLQHGNLFRFGYLGKNGKWVQDLPMVFGSPARARGINSAGTVIGFFIDSNGFAHGFVLQSGVATQVDFPDGSEQDTFLQGINDKGIVTGGWDKTTGEQGGTFTFDIATDTFKSIKVKGATTVSAFGINNAGMIAIDSDVGAFLYCPKTPKHCPGGHGLEMADEPSIVVHAGVHRQ